MVLMTSAIALRGASEHAFDLIHGIQTPHPPPVIFLEWKNIAGESDDSGGK